MYLNLTPGPNPLKSQTLDSPDPQDARSVRNIAISKMQLKLLAALLTVSGIYAAPIEPRSSLNIRVADGNSWVTLYTEDNRGGLYKTFLMQPACQNVPPEFNDRFRSVTLVNAHCGFYEDIDCKGRAFGAVAHPETWREVNLANVHYELGEGEAWNNRISSMWCIEDHSYVYNVKDGGVGK